MCVCKKISPAIGALGRIARYLDVTHRRNIYFSLVHSHLSYLTLIWSKTSQNKLKPLLTLQNRAVKRLFQLSYLHPTEQLYLPNKIMNIHSMYIFQVCTFIHQRQMGEVHSNLSLTSTSQIHSYNVRSKNNLRTVSMNTAAGQRSVLFEGVKLYNALPDEVKSINSVNAYKQKLKQLIFCNYFNNK